MPCGPVSATIGVQLQAPPSPPTNFNPQGFVSGTTLTMILNSTGATSYLVQHVYSDGTLAQYTLDMNGQYTNQYTLNGSTGAVNITNLYPYSQVHIRCAAVNGSGTTWGPVQLFSTGG